MDSYFDYLDEWQKAEDEAIPGEDVYADRSIDWSDPNDSAGSCGASVSNDAGDIHDPARLTAEMVSQWDDPQLPTQPQVSSSLGVDGSMFP